MNPNFRKVALVAATLGLLVSFFMALRPDDDETAASPSTTTDLTTPTPPETPATTTETTPQRSPRPRAAQIRITVRQARPVAGIRRASVRKGRSVVLTVQSDLEDEVHLHGYDLSKPVGPGRPARIAFRATIPGRFDLELEERGIPIGHLEVRP